MKNFKTIITSLIIVLVLTSCGSSDQEEALNQLLPLETKTIKSLHIPGEGRGQYKGPFTKFSFSEGKQVEDDNWDIAFRATDIIVNGGTKGLLLDDIDRVHDAAIILLEGTFSSIKEAPADTDFKQDTAERLALEKGSGKGWYNYNFTTHAISPIAGKILVVKTHNGHYAKVEILSYYKNPQDILSDPQHLTFNYIYNPNKGDKALQ